jgi:hypothetical protein
VTPDGIRKLLDVPEPMTEAARFAANEFSAKLVARGGTRFALDPNSSDLLLVILLPKISKHLAVPSLDAGTEGIARVRWFAERFQEISRAEGKS